MRRVLQQVNHQVNAEEILETFYDAKTKLWREGAVAVAKLYCDFLDKSQIRSADNPIGRSPKKRRKPNLDWQGISPQRLSRRFYLDKPIEVRSLQVIFEELVAAIKIKPIDQVKIDALQVKIDALCNEFYEGYDLGEDVQAYRQFSAIVRKLLQSVSEGKEPPKACATWFLKQFELKISSDFSRGRFSLLRAGKGKPGRLILFSSHDKDSANGISADHKQLAVKDSQGAHRRAAVRRLGCRGRFSFVLNDSTKQSSTGNTDSSVGKPPDRDPVPKETSKQITSAEQSTGGGLSPSSFGFITPINAGLH